MGIAKTATARVLNEFTKPIEVKARESSWIAKIKAIETRPAKITRSKASDSQIRAMRPRPTRMDGTNLRPARSLIASLKECKSLTGI
jgi:hypothetical protein